LQVELLVVFPEGPGHAACAPARFKVSRMWRWLRSRYIGGHQRPRDEKENTVIKRMDNIGIIVDDLEATIAFFAELGLELEGQTTVEGQWVDRVIGLDGARCDIAMMRTPDGHGRVELSKFQTPPATTAEPNAPVNTLGIRRIMFAVEDIDSAVAHMQAHGARLVGEVAQYEDAYRLCYLRGPEGILVGLAEQLS
jgi:catechol 2,3-dioxygenase-like lactoylglutathione lyase family enzyme